jgi:colicin import membrane protein
MSSATERKAQIAAAQEEHERVAREAAEREAKELAEIEEQEVREAEERRRAEARRAEEARKAEEEWRATEAAAKKRQDDTARAKMMEAQVARNTAARSAETAVQSTTPVVIGSTEPGARRATACWRCKKQGKTCTNG